MNAMFILNRLKTPYLMISLMKWNERLSAARKVKGMSKSELSRQVGVSPAAVTMWENGTTSALAGENLMRLCQVLGVSERYLMSGEEPEPDEDDYNEARSLGLQAETAAELRLLSIYRLANQRERAEIDGVVEDMRQLIETRSRGKNKSKRG
jgi:transcriptional regulator with XRE-family HTH domain